MSSRSTQLICSLFIYLVARRSFFKNFKEGFTLLQGNFLAVYLEYTGRARLGKVKATETQRVCWQYLFVQLRAASFTTNTRINEDKVVNH